ncbi:putative membrane protein [Phytophthora megakarya]|uniref:Putative membrane protein n=1 Tax=Phytophthora megakarya TaxID=4795 RepID=A0A225WMD0_9STRA|nr:putative membrane protein [Phytophthora megakarya]
MTLAVSSDPAPNVQNDLNSVAVDLRLNVPGQVHIGTYRHVNNGLYIRELSWVNVYFSLQALALNNAKESVMKWQFRGYECSPNNDENNRVCSEFTTAKLESNRDQVKLPNSQTPHIIDRQSPLTAEERRLQFENPTDVAPPTFTTQTVYYNCAYTGGGSSWCCAQSNHGSDGPYCWNLSKCTEEYSAWNKQNIICCSASAGDCALTYQPPMPTTTPATPAPTTTAPATEDPFGDVPILADIPTSAPSTPTPTTATPGTFQSQ